MSQEKLLSELKENALAFTPNQKIQEANVAKIIQNATEAKEDKNFLNTYILDDWDNWHPDPY